MKKLYINITSIFLMLLLTWLTSCVALVNEARNNACDFSTEHTQEDNPLTNTNEEKPPSAINSLTEEFLHTYHDELHVHPLQISVAYIHAHESTYIAYHGEMLCPPPNTLG